MKMWRLNNMLLNNKWLIEEIKEEIEKIPGDVKMETKQSKIYGTLQKQFSEENFPRWNQE